MQVFGALSPNNPENCLVVECELDVAIFLTVCFSWVDEASEAGVQLAGRVIGIHLWGVFILLGRSIHRRCFDRRL